jgi:hypothetical protein
LTENDALAQRQAAGGGDSRFQWRTGSKLCLYGLWKLRDASSQIGNLADALDFSQPNPHVTNLPLPSAPGPVPCLSNLLGFASTAAPSGNEWWHFKQSGLLKGWEGLLSKAQNP